MTLINDKIVTYDNCGRDAVFFIHTSCSLLSSPQYLLYGDMLYPVSAMCLPLEALVTIKHSK
jgi:hypothetical protein